MSDVRLIFTTGDARADEAIIFLCSPRGVRALLEAFGGLATGLANAVDLHALPFVECQGLSALRAEVVPAEPDSESPLIARAFRRLLQPGPRRGLIREGEDTRGSRFRWLLNASYWEEFVERLQPLVADFRDGSYCYLPSGYSDDAVVMAECRLNS